MSLSREFLYELHKNISGDIRTDPVSKILYSTDASIYQIEPLGVVIPRTQEELHAAVELAAKYKIPILPRGAGTSLAGQAIGKALILDCSRWLDKIVDINPEERFAVVEPGVVLSDLNKAAAQHGLMFGPDPASAERATMGGVIANNATGAHSILYGMSADHIVDADVILGDGSLETWGDDKNSKLNPIVQTIRERYAETIKQNYPKTWRNAAGYRLNYLLSWSPSTPPQWGGDYPVVRHLGLNLAPLLAGSEGTLAVIQRMKVNLVPTPKQVTLVVLSYFGIAEACDDVPRLLSQKPSAIELIPRSIIHAARSSAGYARNIDWLQEDPAALLVVEFTEGCDQISNIGNNVIAVATSKEDQWRIWNVRKVGLGLMDSKFDSARPIAFIEDCAIPVERLGEFVREVEKILSAYGTEGGIYAHASAGCLHIRPVLDLRSAHGVASLRSISEAVLALTLSLGGSMSSEHGDGLGRSEHLARAYGAEVMDAMRLLKDAADPHRILNPGKIIDPLKLDENLRYGAGYESSAWNPSLAFIHEGSFELAIEQCNGQGVCRKTSGVMCPSYQATREEIYSTRGRANLLRAMIAVGGKDLLMESTFRALDLCLACKGCKAECPSGVDMAKMKYEFENEYYKSRRRPLRDYVFGYFHVVAKMLSYVAPVANGLMEFDPTRRLIAKMLGLAEERALPRIIKRHVILSHEAAKNLPPREETLRFAQSDIQRVIFLPDVFSRYIEPKVEEAALEVLTMCGYDVHVLPIVGAGASLLSKGFVDAAKRHARKTLELLNQLDPSREAFIVGVEPPEIYLLKNDYVDLLPEREEEINQRAKNVWLLDEFLLRSKNFDALRVARLEQYSPAINKIQKGKEEKIKFHPHCHQRAEGPSPDGIASGVNASVELLRACGFDVELSEAGCCGMAGTFGYEVEHYEVSMRIAELKLLPFLTQSPPSLRDTSSKSEIKSLNQNQNQNVNVGFGGGWEGVEIVSTGAACRMQVRHGTGLEARHTIEWVRDAVCR